MEVLSQKIKEVAKSKIGDLSMEYNYEYAKGNAPDSINAKGTIENSNTVVDAAYYPTTNNFQATFHYMPADFDVTVIEQIFSEIQEILKR